MPDSGGEELARRGGGVESVPFVEPEVEGVGFGELRRAYGLEFDVVVGEFGGIAVPYLREVLVGVAGA